MEYGFEFGKNRVYLLSDDVYALGLFFLSFFLSSPLLWPIAYIAFVLTPSPPFYILSFVPFRFYAIYLF